MPDDKIFRQQALDTVSNPEQLDQHVRITKPSVWIIVVGILALVIGVLIWSVTGTITTTQNMQGVLFPADSVKIATSVAGGKVTDLLVEEAEEVEKGDVLAIIPDLATLEQLKSVKSNEVVYKALRDTYVNNSFITANKGGTVTKIATLGETVAPGEQVAMSLINDESSSSKEILAYIPYSRAVDFKVGMEAQVTPANLKREEYGYMVGTITKIGTSTITNESITSTMGTTKYVSALGLTGNEIEVRVRLNSDSSSKNGFEWSNSKGANAQVNTGAICNIQVVIDSKKPIRLFF